MTTRRTCPVPTEDRGRVGVDAADHLAAEGGLAATAGSREGRPSSSERIGEGLRTSRSSYGREISAGSPLRPPPAAQHVRAFNVRDDGKAATMPYAHTHSSRLAAGQLAGDEQVVLQLLARVLGEDPQHVDVSRVVRHLWRREPSPVPQAAVRAVSVEEPGDHVGVSRRTCGMQC